MKDFDQDTSIKVFDELNETENIEGPVFYSSEENEKLHNRLVKESRKYIDIQLAMKLDEKDKNLYKVLYKEIPRNIHNYDFYIAFRNAKIDEFTEKDKPIEISDGTKTKKSIIKWIKDKIIIYDESQLDSNMGNIKNVEKCPVDWSSTLFVIILILFMALVYGTMSFLVLAFVFQVCSDFPSVAKILVIAGIEALLLFALFKIVENKLIKKKRNIKKLKDKHPYYKLCKDLHYFNSNNHLLHPVSEIEETYKESKIWIEKEWTDYYANSFSNTLFRFKPINVFVNNDYYFRFFIEIYYMDCFPDYPELLNVEQQIDNFIRKLIYDYKNDEIIPIYKNQIRDYIAGHLSKRLPNMVVEDIAVASVKIKRPINKK